MDTLRRFSVKLIFRIIESTSHATHRPQYFSHYRLLGTPSNFEWGIVSGDLAFLHVSVTSDTSKETYNKCYEPLLI